MENWQHTLDASRSLAGVTGASFAYWDGEALHTADGRMRFRSPVLLHRLARVS